MDNPPAWRQLNLAGQEAIWATCLLPIWWISGSAASHYLAEAVHLGSSGHRAGVPRRRATSLNPLAGAAWARIIHWHISFLSGILLPIVTVIPRSESDGSLAHPATGIGHNSRVSRRHSACWRHGRDPVGWLLHRSTVSTFTRTRDSRADSLFDTAVRLLSGLRGRQ